MACNKGCDAPNPTVVCAARMSDGHAFTDYRSRCATNSQLMKQITDANMVAGSYESRMYLQQNAEKLMAQNFEWAQGQLMPCAPCQRPFNEDGTMLPERYQVRCNPTSCSRVEVNPNGIGDGRMYYNDYDN